MKREQPEIIYRDEYLVAVNKPHDLLVHKTEISSDRVFLLQMVRDMTGQRVYPLHRLDRPTSGIVLFALNSETAGIFCKKFRESSVHRTYSGLVRGYIKEDGEQVIDYDLRDEEKPEIYRSAVTKYECLKRAELDIPVRPYKTSRYSLVRISPQTGRMHQIRRHFAHIRHPLIGDVKRGDGKHNLMFRERFGMNRLMLHAAKVSFTHPFTDESVCIKAEPDRDFKRIVDSVFGV